MAVCGLKRVIAFSLRFGRRLIVGEVGSPPLEFCVAEVRCRSLKANSGMTSDDDLRDLDLVDEAVAEVATAGGDVAVVETILLLLFGVDESPPPEVLGASNASDATVCAAAVLGLDGRDMLRTLLPAVVDFLVDLDFIASPEIHLQTVCAIICWWCTLMCAGPVCVGFDDAMILMGHRS